VRKIFQITATMAVGITLLSCSPRHRVVYLPPPPAYWPSPLVASVPPPGPMAYSSPPSTRYGKSSYARSETLPRSDAQLAAQSSPRRSEVKATKTDPEAKFKAVQVKAEKIGVENLTEDDVAGLSPAQLKVLRGY
jgi:hypothetical protein